MATNEMVKTGFYLVSLSFEENTTIVEASTFYLRLRHWTLLTSVKHFDKSCNILGLKQFRFLI